MNILRSFFCNTHDNNKGMYKLYVARIFDFNTLENKKIIKFSFVVTKS